jgi:hypothetical protein
MIVQTVPVECKDVWKKNEAIIRLKIIFQKSLATSARWASLALPNENWALGGCGDKIVCNRRTRFLLFRRGGFEIQLAPSSLIVKVIS